MQALKFVLAFGALAASATRSEVTPVGKVVQMLSDMKAKGQQTLDTEQQVYADYAKWVRAQTRELNGEIKDDKATIEKLIAFVEKADADVAKLTKEIAANDKETNTLEADLKASTAMRNSERDKFLAEQTDYSESLYALDRAIQMLKAQDSDRPQAMILLQGMTKKVRGMSRVLASLALEETRGDGAPAVAAYEFQSGNIVEMLEGLKDKFRKELADLEKEEANSQHAFDMEAVHLTNTIDNLKAEREELAQTKAKTASDSAAAKGDLADTKASLADAEELLKVTTSTYQTKTATYKANQQVRKEEIEAIGKAIDIISNPDVAGAYGDHVNAEFLQEKETPRRKLSLLQVHSASRRGAARQAAAEFLQRQANALDSKTLSTVLTQLNAGNPFDKVVKMIEDLLDKLKEEAASEADHKAYCDKELNKNKHKRDKKTSEVKKLMAEIDETAAQIMDMAKKLSTLAEQQAALRTAQSEATATRSKEKKANEDAIKDSAAAQVALQSAIAVLKDFYTKASGASFVQQVPEMEEYKGMQRANGGVMGMLEVIMSDFARVEADTRASEEQATAEYNTFMADSNADLKAKHDAEFKTGLKKDEAEFQKEQLEKNLAASSKQLDMANAYYQELKPQCVEVHVSFEERAKRRQEEIEALQGAYKIMDQKR